MRNTKRGSTADLALWASLAAAVACGCGCAAAEPPREPAAEPGVANEVDVLFHLGWAQQVDALHVTLDDHDVYAGRPAGSAARIPLQPEIARGWHYVGVEVAVSFRDTLAHAPPTDDPAEPDEPCVVTLRDSAVVLNAGRGLRFDLDVYTGSVTLPYEEQLQVRLDDRSPTPRPRPELVRRARARRCGPGRDAPSEMCVVEDLVDRHAAQLDGYRLECLVDKMERLHARDRGEAPGADAMPGALLIEAQVCISPQGHSIGRRTTSTACEDRIARLASTSRARSAWPAAPRR
jgi:hypothetical protein